MLKTVLSVLLILVMGPSMAAPVSTHIKLDHFGYRPADTKVAVFSANPGSSVEIRDVSDTVVYRVPADGGSIVAKGNDGIRSGDEVWWVDFSDFSTAGSYRLYSPSLGAQSYDFEIADNVYSTVLTTALRTFYLQRCNTPKLPAHAGDWSDAAACHMGDSNTGPAAGHVNHGPKDLTGGWHDAGDYNKYVWGAVASTLLSLLRAYEDNPGVFTDGQLNIPESGNGIPDLLDEVKWELDWLLKMQLPDGSVLYQTHVDGFASNAPPSADTNIRYYQNPTLESGAVFAGSLALASRVYADAGQTAYANSLKAAALDTWAWLQTQGNSKEKVWAAAEIFRMDPTVTSARDHVDSYTSWNSVYFDIGHYDTHAAVTYVQTPAATTSVVSAMRGQLNQMTDRIFNWNDLYRAGMADWSHHWGSNAIRAHYGLYLLKATEIGTTGSHSIDECLAHAADFLHFFHGVNAMSMLYLTNMAALGGEHASYQFYHAWFGDSNNSYSSSNYLGKPASVSEPAYPYFAGTDNLGVNDNKSSTLGPPPGFVPGGPNKDYSGTAIPPGGAQYYNKYYRDWADQSDWTARTWEITENSIGYQGPYAALAAYFAGEATPQCSNHSDCDDGLFCNGSESCTAGACVAGADPCPGQSCDEASDSCFTDACNRNGVCETGEDCTNCPEDCIGGGGGGCGNGVCEPALGEDCLSCPGDCRGKQNGNPRKKYCCGDGEGTNPIGCNDGRCTAEGFQCDDGPAVSYCCGDALCGGPEDSCSCGLDCGAPDANETVGLSCNDGIDNDCDALTDCTDSDCVDDQFCNVDGCDNDGICEAGEDCHSCASDCAGRSKGKPADRYCCGDGSAQGAEGNGDLCDGNY